MKHAVVVPLVAMMVIASIALAQEAPPKPQPTLKAGDPAPKLFVSKWVKGGPIDELAKGKVYVIECWATWCGPCKAAIPHVTKLQKQYQDKGLVIIGMNVWERDAAQVEPFVKQMGAKMDYAVAMDDVSEGRPGKTAAAWLQAAGRNGIPCSFIVDREGKLAWIGHPMAMDGPLAKVIEGKFDAAEQAKLDARAEELGKQLSQAMREKETDKAMAIADQLIAANPGMAALYQNVKLSLLMSKGDYAGVNALANQLAQSNDEMVLGRVAFTLLNASGEAAEKVDLKLALTLAQKVAAGNPDEPQVQSLLARAHAANKQYDKAIEIQTKVVEQSKGAVKAREEKMLEQYKEKAGK